ncbi:hypothetical protein PTTG_30783 [Puccinia triticina 1-1 BBBD Race 1]|uniref:Uncharacterized protein n=1 Tax=Puccinia triticina (isolate 1-1 / race 1 (BBBD)) TaxID=630390 RepID=A0A180FY60_PUCT1|nr:hypothetical protein PTTG_30783 [Puccinia triticina 1-1 BBBD Race 1]
MKETDHASNYIASFRALQSRLPGLPSRILDLLSQNNAEEFLNLGELIDATLRIDVRFHERQKEKRRENNSHPAQSKKDNSSKPTTTNTGSTTSSSTAKPTSKAAAEITKVLTDGHLQASEKERRLKAGLCLYCGGQHKFEDCAKRAARKSGKV